MNRDFNALNYIFACEGCKFSDKWKKYIIWGIQLKFQMNVNVLQCLDRREKQVSRSSGNKQMLALYKIIRSIVALKISIAHTIEMDFCQLCTQCKPFLNRIHLSWSNNERQFLEPGDIDNGPPIGAAGGAESH